MEQQAAGGHVEPQAGVQVQPQGQPQPERPLGTDAGAVIASVVERFADTAGELQRLKTAVKTVLKSSGMPVGWYATDGIEGADPAVGDLVELDYNSVDDEPDDPLCALVTLFGFNHDQRLFRGSVIGVCDLQDQDDCVLLVRGRFGRYDQPEKKEGEKPRPPSKETTLALHRKDIQDGKITLTYR